jgi:spore germination protein GerM
LPTAKHVQVKMKHRLTTMPATAPTVSMMPRQHNLNNSSRQQVLLFVTKTVEMQLQLSTGSVRNSLAVVDDNAEATLKSLLLGNLPCHEQEVAEHGLVARLCTAEGLKVTPSLRDDEKVRLQARSK